MRLLAIAILAILPVSAVAQGGFSLAERFVADRLSTNREPGISQWYFRLHPLTNSFVSLPRVTGFRPGQVIQPVGVLEKGATNRYPVPTVPGVNGPVELNQITVLAGRRIGWLDEGLFKNPTHLAALKRDTSTYDIYEVISGRMVQLEITIPDETKLMEIYGK
jgi:hypothetical protein